MIRSQHVRLSTAVETSAARIDPHFFTLIRQIGGIVDSLRSGIRLMYPATTAISNGLNLPEDAYDYLTTTPDLLYVSVGAISQYALRRDRAIAIKDPLEYAYASDPTAVACTAAEILVTRSGTPGIAWPAAEIVETADAPRIVPSGFVIRVSIDPLVADPFFVAAILNHPVWRTWTTALATGKSQLNLSQDQLGEVLIPAVPLERQSEIGSAYRRFLGSISALHGSGADLEGSCDAIVCEVLGRDLPRLARSSMTVDRLNLSDALSRSSQLRIDCRFQSGEVRDILAPLQSLDVVALRDLVAGDPVKGRQPTILDETEADELSPRVVSTAAVQAGVVRQELTKPTTEAEVAHAGDRLILPGDLLVTMDGEGSIGKAAVFESGYEAVPDSHVIILRLRDPSTAPTLACMINSGLGQAQIDLCISGSTGQTQLSKSDLLDLRVPVAMLDDPGLVALRYTAVTAAFQDASDAIRTLLVEQAQRVSEAVVASGVLPANCAAELEAMSRTESLELLLDAIRGAAA